MENQPANTGQKSRVLIIVLLLLLIVAAGMLYNEKTNNSDLTAEKTDLTSDLSAMKTQYDVLLIGKDSADATLIAERSRIVGLLDSINLLSTDINSLQRYKREARRLRKERKVLLERADSLLEANALLEADLALAGDSLVKSTQANTVLSTENTVLAQKIALGKTLSADGLTATGVKSRFITGTERDTDRANSTEKLKACFTLSKNMIAEKESKTVYIRFVDPAGNVVASTGNNFNFNNTKLPFSASKEVYYENQTLAVCMYATVKEGSVSTGTYAAEVYADNALIGTTQFSMR
ncbi:MAG: hypothetical protein ACI8ZO_000040 [Flavobacteriales bacterium]|jgi:hypothetical protein